VLITLDAHGDLERVEVLGQSGVQDLDEAAVEAFRKISTVSKSSKKASSNPTAEFASVGTLS